MTEEDTANRRDTATLVLPKELTCLQTNQRLLQRNSKQHQYNDHRKHYEQYATRLLDCSHMRNSNKQTSRDTTQMVFYELSSASPIGELGSSVLLQLRRDNTFISPGFLIEEHLGDLYVKGRDAAVGDKHCFYTGHIIGKVGSSVTVSVCNGMVCSLYR